MKTYKFKKEITAEEIEAIIGAAFSGMTFWCDEVDLKENCEVDMPLSEALTHDFRLKIHDMVEDKWHTLTMKKFLKGLAMMDSYDYYEYDMYDCEKVIQYALFGELRYS